nr:PREDICTED: protein LNK1-like isoform X2 [Musa acuminata subsp. malaccensis]
MDLDSSVEKSSSISSVFSDDISKEAISFHQLQDVICQLNLRTKLCLRDTSHHLARSAEPRGRLLTVNSGNEECRRVHRTGKSTKLVEYMNIETKTNPIHQFVALLPTVDPRRLQLDLMMMLCHSSLKRLHVQCGALPHSTRQVSWYSMARWAA